MRVACFVTISKKGIEAVISFYDCFKAFIRYNDMNDIRFFNPSHQIEEMETIDYRNGLILINRRIFPFGTMLPMCIMRDLKILEKTIAKSVDSKNYEDADALVEIMNELY